MTRPRSHNVFEDDTKMLNLSVFSNYLNANIFRARISFFKCTGNWFQTIKPFIIMCEITNWFYLFETGIMKMENFTIILRNHTVFGEGDNKV